MFRHEDRRGPITPQLALRVAFIGGVCLVMFGVIFFRLWYLQVLSGDKYLAEANNNRVRNITVQAPRGRILDRNGRVLVDNRSGYSVEVNPAKLPADQRAKSALYKRLSRVLGMSPNEIRHTINGKFRAVPFANAVVKPDVSRPVFSYILENQDRFPGVTVEQVFLRAYPNREIAAHLVGYVHEASEEQLRDKLFRGVSLGDRVGQAGVELTYDRYLRGINGANRVQVDASGVVRGELARRDPRPGHQLRLAIDLGVQERGQRALAGRQGAFVAMDVRTGEVRALGSAPSYDPSIFSKQIRQADFTRLSAKVNGEPLLDRAVLGAYPTGSTFKPITAVAALESGVIGTGTTYTDGGSFSLGPGAKLLTNAGGAVYGTIALPQALRVSSDVFFYHLGAQLFSRPGAPLQRWAARFGIGRKTGIDLPAEASGQLPTKQLGDYLWRHKLTDHPWSIGDDVNLAIGQGCLLANPLQMAVAYAAIANGGYVVKPHLGLRVEDREGRTLQELRTPARRHVAIQRQYRQAILDGLQAAAEQPHGTSYPVFGADVHFPIRIAGKTGTAQTGGLDQSWYVALAPYPHPKFVVAVTVEKGGFGVETAAPAAKQIIAKLFNVKARGGGPVNLQGINRNG
jgi:penicillin-binding protein 2